MTPPGVEPGVTGKERTFQQNRAFGPGAMKPYIQQMAEKRSHSTGNGVFYGQPNRNGRSENPGLGKRRYLGPGRLV